MDAFEEFEQKINEVEKKTVVILVSPPGRKPHLKPVTLDWRCPTCGERRGSPVKVKGRDGLTFHHKWTNPCGHVDLYDTVLSESQGLPVKTEQDVVDPYWMWSERE